MFIAPSSDLKFHKKWRELTDFDGTWGGPKRRSNCGEMEREREREVKLNACLRGNSLSDYCTTADELSIQLS
jgi:hypothetical protein